MYTKKKFFKILSYLIICLSTYIVTLITTTSAHSKIFKIEDIEIYEPFNANFNKEIVINKAFSTAFRELISSLQNWMKLNTLLTHLKLKMKVF